MVYILSFYTDQYMVIILFDPRIYRIMKFKSSKYLYSNTANKSTLVSLGQSIPRNALKNVYIFYITPKYHGNFIIITDLENPHYAKEITAYLH